ncbi:MAG: branched-chain amino acid transport system ATP-binding protein [Nitriliruptoraceae bacterium]|jgi:branched-chain amino acid transport system ATP-binding protein
MSSTTGEKLLEFKGVNTHYGPVHVLKDLNMVVREGELVSLLGGNASGKTTTLKTILGIVAPTSGTVHVTGKNINGWTTADVVTHGVSMVPENRRLFKRMSILENLELGAYLRDDKAEIAQDIQMVYDLFPRVYERREQKAGTLSGGEQQMVAMGRALMSRPRLLLMDEPSMGLAPALVQTNFAIIEKVHKEGMAMLVVEQNANMALSIADRGYVIQTGAVVLEDTAENLLANPQMRAAYLGGH